MNPWTYSDRPDSEKNVLLAFLKLIACAAACLMILTGRIRGSSISRDQLNESMRSNPSPRRSRHHQHSSRPRTPERCKHGKIQASPSPDRRMNQSVNVTRTKSDKSYLLKRLE